MCGGGGERDDIKQCETAKQIWEHKFFMQASDFVIFVINYLNEKKFFAALSTFCDTFLTFALYTT